MARRMVIDRLSRCFVSKDGLNYELVPIPGVSSDEPLKACCHSGNKWWVCGENGVVLSSQDGRSWNRHLLPGLQSDWDLFSLRSIIARGNEVWICGNPGLLCGTRTTMERAGLFFKQDKTSQLTLSPFSRIPSSRVAGLWPRSTSQEIAAQPGELHINQRADSVL